MLSIINILFHKVWKTEENCSASEGSTGVIKQVLDLEGEKLERLVECFNERVNGTLSSYQNKNNLYKLIACVNWNIFMRLHLDN